jgi:hypothetical protein
MPSYPESQLALIDSRVADGMVKTTKMGTVSSRSPGNTDPDGGGAYRATVVFDGSSGTAQPVKCPESVLVDIGDRVGVVRYESEWLITTNYTLRRLADGFVAGQFPIANTTSATFVDAPNSPTVTLPIKYRDATIFRIYCDFTLYTTALASSVEFAAFILSADGLVSYDQVLFHRAFNEANSHRTYASGTDTAAFAGGQGYLITLRWRRSAGVGTLSVNSDAGFSLRVQEVIA